MLVGGEDRRDALLRLVADPPILLRQEIHGELHALEVAAGNRQVARVFSAAGEHDRIVVAQQVFRREIDADMRAIMERYALRLHLIDAAIDEMLLHFEVGDAVAHQPAGLGVLLEHMHVVPRPRELLCAGEPGGSGSDDRDGLAGLPRRGLGPDPPFLERLVDDRAFDRLDRHRIVVEIEGAGRLARRRADAPGDLGEIVGRVEIARGFLPVAQIDEIVPVGDLVVHRAAGVTIGDAAVHAARRLVPQFRLRERDDEFAVVAQALLDRRVVAVGALEFQKTGDLTH